jgi:NTE family protein
VRAIIEVFEQLEASVGYQRALRIDQVRRIALFVVNSLSDPRSDWDRHERPPNDVQILIKATGVPIDRYSSEAVALLKEVAARWENLRTPPDFRRLIEAMGRAKPPEPVEGPIEIR